jgi:hypothetical protein
MKKLLACLVPALLLGVPGLLHAQDQAAPAAGVQAPAAGVQAPATVDQTSPAPVDKAPRRLLFVMEKGGLFSSYTDNELIILKRSFLTALSDVDDAPVPIDYSLKSFPGSTEDRNKVAREAGADCWLVVKISGRGSPTLSVVSYDLLYNIKTLDFSVTRHEAFSMLDVYRERWDDVIPRVVKTYPPLVSHAYSRGPPGPVMLTIRAVPGTTIAGLSPKPLSVGQDGRATIELPSPAPYSLRATAFGYVPHTADIYLNGQTELSLTQVRSPWLKLDGGFQDGLFPSASANFSIPSLPFFARLEITTFRVGIAVNQNQLFVSLPLTTYTFLLGLYLSPEDRDARWYVGAGPLLRVSWPGGAALVVDNLLPFGVRIVGGCDFPLFGRMRSFVEFTPTAYYTPQPGLFVASFGNKDGNTMPYITVPPHFALDLLEIRFGLRYPL